MVGPDIKCFSPAHILWEYLVLRRCQNCASAVLLFDSGTLSLGDSFSHLLTSFCLTDSRLSIKEVPVCLWINSLHVCSGLHCKKNKKKKHSAPPVKCKTAGRYLVHHPGRKALGWRKHKKSPYSLLTRGTQGHLMRPWDLLLLPPLKKLRLVMPSLSARLKEGKGSRGFEDQIMPL